MSATPPPATKQPPPNPSDETLWEICRHTRTDLGHEGVCNKCPATVSTSYGECTQACRSMAEDAYQIAASAVMERLHQAKAFAPSETQRPSVEIVESARYWSMSANEVKDNLEYREAFARFRDEILRLAATRSAIAASDYEEVLADHRRLVRELDVAMHGEEGAAKQASLCDLVPLARRLRAEALTNNAKYEGAVGACAHFAADAARYLWLRDKRISGAGVPSLATYAGSELVSWDATGADTDRAIDSAKERQSVSAV